MMSYGFFTTKTPSPRISKSQRKEKENRHDKNSTNL